MKDNYCECDCHKGERMCQTCREQEERPCAVAAGMEVQSATAGSQMAQAIFADARHRIHSLVAAGWDPRDALSIVLTGLCGALVMSLTHLSKVPDNEDPQQIAHNMVDMLWGIKPSGVVHAEMN